MLILYKGYLSFAIRIALIGTVICEASDIGISFLKNCHGFMSYRPDSYPGYLSTLNKIIEKCFIRFFFSNYLHMIFLKF